MAIYQVSVYVDYTYDVQADSYEEAEAQIIDYKKHLHTGEIFGNHIGHISDRDMEEGDE